MRLSRADLQGVVDLLGEAVELESDEAYAPEFLVRLQNVIDCDAGTYQEYDYAARRSCLEIGFEPSGFCRWGTTSGEPPQSEPDYERYWIVGPCPIVHHRMREGDLDAIRMSDVVSPHRFRQSAIYNEFFRPLGIGPMLDLGLPAQAERQRSLILFRSTGETDFSERDRAVLELLRPHLYQRERTAALRQRLDDLANESELDDGAKLTPREHEIVELVAKGKTNAEIAAELWIAPSTVKKHLENVYEKLGVGRRAAAATLVRSAQ